MDKLLIALIATLLIGGGIYFILQNAGPFKKTAGNNIPAAQITNFDECAAAGYPVAESYPRQCRTPDGKNFTENIGNELEMADMIKTDSPRPNTKIASPLTIAGRARGNWYFEASFPVKLVDAHGNQLASGIATANGEWMTTEFVPFTAALEFTAPQTATGNLILNNDNPSGLPENDQQLIIPVKF